MKDAEHQRSQLTTQSALLKRNAGRRTRALLLLLPIAILVAAEVAARFVARWTDAVATTWSIYLIALLSLVIALPEILCRLCSTSELRVGGLRSRLELLARLVGTRVRFRVWFTHANIRNAVLIGLFPTRRTVLLSDGLLRDSTQEDIEAVVLHELAHAQRKHLLWRTLVLFPPLCLLVLLMSWHIIPQADGVGGLALWLILSVGYVVYGIAAVGWLSRKLEHDADYWTWRWLDATSCEMDEPASRAIIDRFCCQLERMTGTRHLRKATWLHPSVSQRREFLQNCAANQLFARRHSDAVRHIAGILVAIVVATAAALLATAVFCR